MPDRDRSGLRPAEPGRSAPAIAEAAFSHRDILGILSGVLVGMFLAALDQTIVATALPTIAAELHGSEHLSWIVAGYLITSTAATPIYGKLSDLYGRRVLMQIAIVIFVLTSALCALAQSMPQLVFARALQGVGGGGLITLAQATIADVVAPRERGRYQAYLSGVWATASVGGPVLGGYFAEFVSWRWIFWINLPLGALAFAMCAIALRRLPVRRMQRPVDYAGAALLMTAVTALLLATSWGGTVFPWFSPPILGLVFGGLVLVGIFILQEFRATEPLIPPRLFMDPVIRIANIASFTTSMAMFGATIFLPVFLQLVGGVSASHSGLLIVPLMGGTVIGAYISGRVMRRTGRYKPLPLSGIALAAGALMLLVLVTESTPPALVLAHIGAIGLGFGCMMPAMLVAVQNAAGICDIGAATSSVAFFRSLGGSFGVAALWSILLITLGALLGQDGTLDSALLHGGPEALAHLPPELRDEAGAALTRAFHVVFMAAGAFAALSFLVVLRLEERPLRTQSEPMPDISAPQKDR